MNCRKDYMQINHENMIVTPNEDGTYKLELLNCPFKDNNGEEISGIITFPIVLGAWCNSKLKVSPMNRLEREMKNKKTVQYLGIACDEPERIARHSINKCKVMPLVDIEWNEAYCRKWCEENNLLSPTYENADRGGCWFCHNQSVDQLRFLRKTYPNLWKLLLKWDKDSPVTFKADKHTVADYEKRFQAEDDGKIVAGDKKFRWKQVLEDIESK